MRAAQSEVATKDRGFEHLPAVTTKNLVEDHHPVRGACPGLGTVASLFSHRPVPCVTSGRKSTIAGSDVAPCPLCSPSLDEGGRCAPAVSFRYWLVDPKNQLSARCATCTAFPFTRLSLLSYVKDSNHASGGAPGADCETRETEGKRPRPVQCASQADISSLVYHWFFGTCGTQSRHDAQKQNGSCLP